MAGILAYGNSIYTTVAHRIGNTAETKPLVDALLGVQAELKCPVLSAKHIGFDLQVFVVDLNHLTIAKEDFKGVFVNPELLETFAPLMAQLEEDVCIPKLAVSVDRPKSVKVKLFNERFEEQTLVFNEAPARYIQQGIDLLQGTTIMERLNPHRQRSVKGHLKRISEKKIETNYQLEYEN